MRRRPFLFPLLLFLLLLGVPAAGQGPLFGSDRLVGWVEPPGTAANGQIDLQTIATCPPAATVCKPVFGQPTSYYAGGTAYDPRRQSVWVSQGSQLAEIKIRGCQTLCKQIPTLVGGSSSMVTGLAISDAKPRLFQLESYPGNMAIVTYDNSTCPPKPVSKCTMAVPPKTVAGGLAYDEGRDLVYFTLSSPQGGGVWNSTLFVAKAATPCKPFCKWPIPTKCAKNLVTGLAYNVCRGELYAAHGQTTTVIYVADPLNCKFLFRRCCKKGSAGDWRGLAFVPGWKVASLSKSCTQAPCPSCPLMKAGLFGGDASLGNPAFGVQITGAPSGSTGILLLKAGPCGTGFNIPFLCGDLYPFPPDLAFLAPLTGTGSCGGSAKLPLPLPANAAICNSVICAQWLVFCSGGAGFGFGVSNAIQFSIASS